MSRALRRLQQEQHHRRDEDRLGDALLLDDAQNRRRIEIAGQHVLDAAKKPDQRPAAAADMKERHADEVDVAVVPIAPLVERAGQQGEQIVVAQLRALGMAGRAAGIHLDGAILAADRPQRIQRLLAVAPFPIIRPGRVPAVERDDAAHRLELVRHLLDRRVEIGADEQQLGLGVIDDEGDLGWRQAEIDRHQHDARLGRAEPQFEEGGDVLRQEGDPPRGRDVSGDQALRHLAGPPVEHRISDLFAFEMQRHHLGARCGVAACDVGNGRNRGNHASPPCGCCSPFWPPPGPFRGPPRRRGMPAILKGLLPLHKHG